MVSDWPHQLKPDNSGLFCPWAIRISAWPQRSNVVEVWIPAQKAVGQKFMFDWQGKSYPFKMMGVVKDFHFSGFAPGYSALAFMLNNRPEFDYIIVHARPTSMADVLNFLEEKWTSLRPDEPFELGATMANIVLLLSRDFPLLVLMAILIASLLA